MVTQSINLAVIDRQHGLGVFSGNAKDGDDPHPKHGTGPANGDGASDPSDVAGADGGGERCHQGAEGRDVTDFCARRRSSQHAHAIGQPLQRHQLQPQHQDNAGDGNEADHGPAPDDPVDGLVNGRNQIFHPSAINAAMVTQLRQP